ncbi:S9 family peptidase [Novosphingobium sp. 1949]|uniref:S9 family peptidase n=1 Tax=Novosphingobium organovorum TaxID=2930092 RepID=A0ABT0BBY1_9SPHN|nr:S9 family peptidase [Novosphingobium organovorum]MCJ2182556.1 S9 family peptidase [Novosphingobium organovorum]
MLALGALTSVGATIAAAEEGPRVMTAVDLLNLARASSPMPSPDGSAILYRVSHADWDKNKAVSELWRLDAAGGAPRRMLADAGSHASWSPDGRAIAFVDTREGDKTAQIYLLAADGGEARRLSALDTAPSDLVWSDDGKALFFLANVPQSKERTARLKAKDDMVPFEEPLDHKALWRLDLADGAAPAKAQRVVEGGFDVRAFDRVGGAHGGRIVYRRAASGLLDDQSASELYLHVDGAPDRRLTDNDYNETELRLAPDGRSALFIATAKGGRYGTFNPNLFVLDLASGAVREMAAGPDWAVKEAIWSADGRTIYFTAQDGVRTTLQAVDLAHDRVTRLVGGDAVIGGIALSRDGHTLGFAQRTSARPEEIVTFDPARPRPIQRTHLHDDLASRFRLPRQEAIHWTTRDGQKLEGLLTYPLDYQPGKRYPLIVQSHGGPRSADQFNLFAYSRFLPLLTARGAMVLSVNYRGGTGYGDTFLQGMNAGYFRLADKDVLSGVDELVARGLADPDRLGMMGWSAGGHMTARLETVTDRFKAAVVGAGAVDWPSMYLTSDTRWQRKEWFVTPPYGTTARRDLYQDYSPLAAVDKVTTPTLILAGAEDERVPSSQSVMYYRALKALGVESRLYLAPREPHNFRELRHRLFQINAQVEWFSRLVLGLDFTPEEAPEPADS